jgi:hypothetical protein
LKENADTCRVEGLRTAIRGFDHEDFSLMRISPAEAAADPAPGESKAPETARNL